MDHVGKSNKEGPSEHQVGNNPQDREGNGEQEEERSERHPLNTAEVSSQLRLRSGVDALKEALSKDTMINHWLVDEPRKARGTVNLTFPLGGAGWSEEDQVFEAKEGFCLSIPLLLLSESLQGETAIMPDNGRRAKGDHLSLLLKAPAEIHVVAGLSVFRIEAPNFFKGPSVKGHIAARDMFRNDVGEEYMARAAWCRRNACLMPVLRGRGDVRTADASIVA